MFQSWVQTVAVAPAAGATLSNTVTPTSLLPSTGLYTFPANFFQYPGQSFEFEAMGIISSTTGANTLTFNLEFGSVPVITSAFPLVASATNITWELRGYGTVRSLGSGTSTTVMGWSVIHSGAVVGTTLSSPNNGDLVDPYSSPAVSAGWDCTVTQLVNLYGTWSTANASNSITLYSYFFRVLN